MLSSLREHHVCPSDELEREFCTLFDPMRVI
jgi:hypothetical protein